jgi:hypothetical protein
LIPDWGRLGRAWQQESQALPDLFLTDVTLYVDGAAAQQSEQEEATADRRQFPAQELKKAGPALAQLERTHQRLPRHHLFPQQLFNCKNEKSL